MNAVDGEEAKAGKRAGNYGVCKGYFLKQLPTPQKSNYLSACGRNLTCWNVIVDAKGKIVLLAEYFTLVLLPTLRSKSCSF